MTELTCQRCRNTFSIATKPAVGEWIGGPAVPFAAYSVTAAWFIRKMKMCPSCIIEDVMPPAAPPVVTAGRQQPPPPMKVDNRNEAACTACGLGLAWGRLSKNRGFGLDDVLDAHNAKSATKVCSVPCLIELFALADRALGAAG